MTLVEFLLARIAEDGVVAWCAEDCRGQDPRMSHIDHGAMLVGRDRWLSECEAKRQIVESVLHAEERWEAAQGWFDVEVARAALAEAEEAAQVVGGIYADHPDYREEWRP